MSKNKKAAALHGLSKKERKALEARAAQLAAELAEREAKKKAKKKAKGVNSITPADESRAARRAAKPEPVKVTKVGKGKKAKTFVEHIPEPTADEIVAAQAKAAAEDAKAARAAARAIKAAQKAATPRTAEEMPASIDADLAEEKATQAHDDPIAETDAAIKARVQAKRAEREGTSAERLQALADSVKADRTYREELAASGRLTVEPVEGETQAEDNARLAVQVAEVVETDRGREIVVGESVAREEFAKPSDAPRRIEDNTNGNGQYKIVRPSDGREVGYSRVTTYIDCLDDRTQLEKWKARIILEGVASIDGNEDGTQVADRIRGIADTRDAAIAKARKADRKGKLGLGQLEAITSAAWSEFKKGLDAIADEAFEVGGGREKAAKGTDIHELCALAARDGIDAVGDKLTRGEITPADLADVEAFLDALKRLDAKVIGVERVVVLDDLKVAGRLDYILMVKLPGMLRATRLVADLKTGSVEYSVGKIARQLEMYAAGEGYDESDPSTAREDLKLSRTKALLFHLPAGSAKCTVHVVDLGLGRKGNRLAGEVRAFRNEGKRAIDLKADILQAVES